MERKAIKKIIGVVLLTEISNARIEYAWELICSILGTPPRIIHDANAARAEEGPIIVYSEEEPVLNGIHIRPFGLLQSSRIEKQEIEMFELGDMQAFFRTNGDYPFDILSAVFYLVSRYEEYLDHKKDRFGRFAHENSLAYKHSFLDKPLVNVWINHLREFIISRHPGIGQNFRSPSFSFLPTYDIDIAWSYKNKGIRRNVGGMMRSVLRGKWSMFTERISVLKGTRPDPFDSYEWMDKLHERFRLKPFYFFHLGGQPGKYDKNISPKNSSLQKLIRDHVAKYQLGLHPSWATGDNSELLKKEMSSLELIGGRRIDSSRQHYIRFNLPGTYRHLEEAGIGNDYSMGYGSINGFRASIAFPFFWFDLEKDVKTGLRVFPFCFMDANSFYEQKFSSEQAYEEMMSYYRRIYSVNGLMITIWHNNFLGTDTLYNGWREVYERFLNMVTAKRPRSLAVQPE